MRAIKPAYNDVVVSDLDSYVSIKATGDDARDEAKDIAFVTLVLNSKDMIKRL